MRIGLKFLSLHKKLLKKRIIFALLYSDGYFFLSRNFRLQKVGDVNWLINNFGFGKTCHFIDELICLLIKENPTKDDKNKFFSDINNLRKKCVKAIKNGDNKCISIASASIIAKVIRDNLMKKLSYKYPDFFWNKNSGYGTKLHINKIKSFGITPHHRKSFKPITKMIK